MIDFYFVTAIIKEQKTMPQLDFGQVKRC